MVRMHVVGLTLDTSSRTPLVILQGEDEDCILPIWVGAMEAMAISLALSGKELARPLTHDIVGSILKVVGASLLGIAIVDLREGTYRAELHIQHGNVLHRVDCRPSDAIALALRAKVEILVTRPVLLRAAQSVSQDNDHHVAMLIKPEDIATDMVRRASAQDTGPHEGPLPFAGLFEGEMLVPGPHAAENTPDAPASPPSEKTDTATTNHDKKLTQMLMDMEPDSKRRM